MNRTVPTHPAAEDPEPLPTSCGSAKSMGKAGSAKPDIYSGLEQNLHKPYKATYGVY